MKKYIKKLPRKEKDLLLISEEEGITKVTAKYLKNISHNEAIALGLANLIELRVTMLDDSIADTDTMIAGTKLVTGLNNTLTMLQQIYPNILKQIHSLEAKYSDIEVFYC